MSSFSTYSNRVSSVELASDRVSVDMDMDPLLLCEGSRLRRLV